MMIELVDLLQLMFSLILALVVLMVVVYIGAGVAMFAIYRASEILKKRKGSGHE